VDVVKSVMAGAHVTQMVSALLRHGPVHLSRVRVDLERWLEEHDCESLRQIQGSMSLQRCPDPAAYRRANYIRMLQSWQAEETK
jgi:dihydroorotate dehydrogenase (fumarate)